MKSFASMINTQSDHNIGCGKKNIVVNPTKSLSALGQHPIKLEMTNKMINNYEIVEYESPKDNGTINQLSLNENDANTIDVYSYQDGFLYQEDYSCNDTIPKTESESFSSGYLKVVPITIVENQNKKNIYSVESLKNYKNLTQFSFIEPDKLNYQKSLESLKKSSSKISHYELSSQVHLASNQGQQEQAQINNYTEKTIKNKLEINQSLCCCQSCFGFLNFFLSFIQCFSSCCFRPCCSTAAVLGGMGALGGALAGAVLLGFLGVIPIPTELSKNICRYDRDGTSLDYPNNFTFFNSSNNNNNYNNDFSNILTHQNENKNQTSDTKTANTTKPINSTNLKKIKIKLRSQNKLKSSFSRFIPLQYDVLFLPNLIDSTRIFTSDQLVQENSNDYGMEMKINLNIKIYCNYSYNILQLSSPEFITIDLSFEKTEEPSLGVKKWSYDSTTNIIDIETTRNCKKNSIYKLNVFIQFKSYGSLIYDKISKQAQLLYLLNFNQKLNYPFPVIVENINNQFAVITGPSIFNVTLAKFKSTQTIIFNMDVLKTTKQESLEFVSYKPTPFLFAQAIGFVIGNLNCIENSVENTLIKLRICSSKLIDSYENEMNLIFEYTANLLNFYINYTKVEYPMSKIDIVLLPLETVTKFVYNDNGISQLGIIYLPQTYVKDIKNEDQLEQNEAKLKIVYMLSKQIGRHWFYSYQECNNQANYFKEDMNDDYTTNTVDLIKNICENKDCSNRELSDTSISSFLDYNENCYLFKGVVSWISYLAFQSVYPDLFELIYLEWQMVRELDENYFFSDSNIKFIYKIYEFPRMTDSDNYRKINNQIKSLLAARTIFQLIGKDRFKGLINDWFRIIQASQPMSNSKNQNEFNLNSFNYNSNISMLNLLEKSLFQYNIIPNENLAFKSVLRSWILAPNDMILTINRNYNKKEAILKLEIPNIKLNSFLNKNGYFPLNWYSRTLKTKVDRLETNYLLSDTNDDENSNLKWINRTNDELKNLPGADKFIIGNHLKTFGAWRINYDSQNWIMLLDQLFFDCKRLNVNDRVQILDDAFYLANNQKLSISTALNFLEYLPNEDNYLPWKFAFKNIKSTINFIEYDSDLYSKFRDYIIRLFKPTYHKLKWGESSSDTIDTKLIRVLVVDLLCSLDYEDCVENSVKQLVDSIKINVYNIPQYLSKSIYCTAIRYTGINEWQYLWKYFLQQSDNLNMRNSLLYSLSCSPHIWILNLFLRKLVYENSVPLEDLPTVFDYISQNPVGRYITWNHISQNYQTFYNKIIQVSTKELKFNYQLKQFYDFIEEIGSNNINLYYSNNNKDKLMGDIQLRINKNSKWRDSNSNDLNEWLDTKLKKIYNYFKKYDLYINF